MRLIFVWVCLFVCIAGFSQQIQYVDFLTASATIDISPESKLVKGEMKLTFKVKQAVDSVVIDAVKMTFTDVILNKKSVAFKVTNSQLVVFNTFEKGDKHTLEFLYTAHPKQTLYFIGWNEKDKNVKKQVWSQGQGKYTKHWLPSFDDMNEKVVFDLAISFSKDYTVLANGNLKSKTPVLNNKLRWHYKMQQPMSSYLVAIAIGKYKKISDISKTGVVLDYYFYPEDHLKVTTTYKHSKVIFDFLEAEIGVPFPWQNYKQAPVRDFLYAGMENTSLTLFSDGFVVDTLEYNDKNYINVNAHELAHQWFGNLVTETTGKHHWLQEGFATYYALLAERKLFGDNHFYWQLYDYAEALQAQEKANKATALLNPKASSVTFYKKGAWALHALQAIIGEKAFKKTIKIYLETYAYKNVKTSNFIKIAETVSKKKLKDFVSLWLESDSLPKQRIKALLYKNKEIEHYDTFVCKNHCAKFINDSVNYRLKSKIIKNHKNVINTAIFKSKDLKFRQFLAEHFQEIPLQIKTEYETLLNDLSYQTKANALYNLWVNFPKNREDYLNLTRKINGSSDKGFRCLWLALALYTPEYDEIHKPDFLEELINYTAAVFSFEVRQQAFQTLVSLQAVNKMVLSHLIAASTHHNWRFKMFSKRLLNQLEEIPEYKIQINKLQQKN